eukprot:m.532568 g.532568  ORF g.532568 m.532568 type:complete len:75 (-) comp22046_c0_seq8:232-456(-)
MHARHTRNIRITTLQHHGGGGVKVGQSGCSAVDSFRDSVSRAYVLRSGAPTYKHTYTHTHKPSTGCSRGAMNLG